MSFFLSAQSLRFSRKPLAAAQRMADPLSFRQALPVLIMLAAAAGFITLGSRVVNVPAPAADVSRLPASMGDWRMIADERTLPAQLAIPADQLKSMSLDSYTRRAYTNIRTHRVLELLVEYRRAGRGAFNHRPDACYPAVGWTLSDHRVVPIEFAGMPSDAAFVKADFNGAAPPRHQVLLYWYATRHRVECDFWKQQVEMAIGRLRPQNNGWAFIQVESENAPGDDRAAAAAEQDFARASSPSIAAAIGGKS